MSLLRTRGVTLVELVVVIVVIGILAGMGALVLVPAYEAYFASQRRAQLADAADTAARRMVRDVRLALPNSVRVDGTRQFIEFLLTKNGGRYRALSDPGDPTKDVLDFSAADDGFDTLGLLPSGGDQQVVVGDFVAIHNLGIPGADAYNVGAANANIAPISNFAVTAGGHRISFNPPRQFPLESPGRRFFVVAGPVTYACVGGELRRWSGYAIQAAQPTALPLGGTQLLADGLTACEFTYSSDIAQLTRGLVTIRLAITRNNETVVLYQQAHVNNVP
jgi:MSHA biogenesis protein MshO